MTMAWPVWLIFAIPAALLLWLRPLPSRGLTILRGVGTLLLLLAICGLGINLPSRHGTVVLVADRSLSMPPGSRAAQLEAAEMLYRSMDPDDRLAVVSFGERTAVDQPPQRSRFGGFVSDVGGEASNLTEGIELAVTLIPHDTPGRVLVLSDGRATGRDVSAAATLAAAAGVSIDYRALQRPSAGDLAIERLDAPSSVAAGEAFVIAAWLESPRAEEISYELRRGEQIISRGQHALTEGRNRLLFRDKVGDAGVLPYELRVKAAATATPDPVPENNVARFLVGVRGNKPLLCVSPKASSLPKLLAGGGLKVTRQAAADCRWTLADLAGFSGVVIEDTPSAEIGTSGMESLSAWVSQAGGGLLTTGGRSAYGTGGYFKSPLEEMLPVSMELRQEHRKLSLAIVVSLDRSGSMAAPVPGGRPKMELANLATTEVLNQLSGMDQFGCMAVDTDAHEIVPLSPVTNKGQMRDKILGIASMGGGIYIDEALAKAAGMISGATAGTRHIILFADASDSEQPGDYKDILQKCTKAGVTVSVIGLGTVRDPDADLLKDIARRGGGQCMFTEDAHELPRLFAQDTFLVARSAFQEELTAVRATPGITALTTQPWGPLPKVGGYNLCYLRPGANLAAVTVDEYQAPLVAAWQAGAGRVLCYTGQADGPYSGPLAKWPKAGDFYCSLARWISPQDQGLGPDMVLTQELQGGLCRIRLHLDSERRAAPFTLPPQLTVLREQPGQKPKAEQWPLVWTGADILSAEVPLRGDQTLLTRLDVPGAGTATLPPKCLPYSAEFAPHQTGDGRRALEQLARATGGTERVDLTGIWSSLPKKPHIVSLAPWLLIGNMVLLLAEVLQRRTGLLSIRWLWPALARRRAAAADAGSDVAPVASKQKTTAPPIFRPAATAAPRPAATTTPSKTAAKSEPPATPAPPPDSVADAMNQARNRARKRTQR